MCRHQTAHHVITIRCHEPAQMKNYSLSDTHVSFYTLSQSFTCGVNAVEGVYIGHSKSRFRVSSTPP